MAMIGSAAASRSAQSTARAYIALTKPRIISLLILTALGGLFLASEGPPDALLTLVVLGGGALAAGGANALNHYLDRDIDGLMKRTASRPVVSGAVPPINAMWFGIALNVVAFIILALFANPSGFPPSGFPLSAVLTLSATLFYVFVYTKGLKRSTPQNIVIGGAAGAIPPMVGWAAVTGGVALPAVYMFAIIFFWTPPHFWALCLMIKDDYAEAGVPMLPVVAGVEETKLWILLYAVILVALTALFALTDAVGTVYLASALALSLIFVWFAWRLTRKPGIEGAKAAYLYSLAYLALLFGAIMVDSVV